MLILEESHEDIGIRIFSVDIEYSGGYKLYLVEQTPHTRDIEFLYGTRTTISDVPFPHVLYLICTGVNGNCGRVEAIFGSSEAIRDDFSVVFTIPTPNMYGFRACHYSAWVDKSDKPLLTWTNIMIEDWWNSPFNMDGHWVTHPLWLKVCPELRDHYMNSCGNSIFQLEPNRVIEGFKAWSSLSVQEVIDLCSDTRDSIKDVIIYLEAEFGLNRIGM